MEEEIPPSPGRWNCLPKTNETEMDDDVIEEILMRLPGESLARCKCLSKKWRTTISTNSYFRSRFFQHAAAAGPSQFLGLFFSDDYGYRTHAPINKIPVSFCPLSHQGLQLIQQDKPSIDPSLSFVGPRRRQPGKTLHLMASSNGFLLCSVQQARPLHYYLCNPITKRWMSLPTPHLTGHAVSHGLFCDPATCYSSSLRYKVVRAVCGNDYSNFHRIEILSSEEERVWKIVRFSCCIFNFQLFDLRSMLVSDRGGGDVLFYSPAKVWPNYTRSVVEFDPRKDHLDLIKMPDSEDFCYKYDLMKDDIDLIKMRDIKDSNEGFGKSEGSIIYVRANSKHLEAWILDQFAREWRIKYKVGIQNSLPQFGELVNQPGRSSYNFKIMAIHPHNSRLMFIHTSKKLVLYDARTSEFRLICDFGEQGWTEARYFFCVYEWPHWPPPPPFVCDSYV